MCGIAGIVGRSDRETLAAMVEAAPWRGPDGRGWLLAEGISLGHARLAIVDVAGGAQPLYNEDRSLALIYNGEIYNHGELRTLVEAGEARAAGAARRRAGDPNPPSRHVFRTRSDGEVLLHLYEEEGPAMLGRLRGMFALALWDPCHGLLLARDPLGVKPLYYGRDADGHFLFASEIRSLLDRVARIEALPPGHYLRVPPVPGGAGATPSTTARGAVPSPAEPTPVRFYAPPGTDAAITDRDEAVAMVRARLTQAVSRRLMADVPVGVFLSGGLDSSIIAALVREHTDEPVHSFSVGLAGSEDLARARQVASFLGTRHHERVLRADEVIEALPRVIEHLESFDPALVRSAIPNFFIAEHAAGFVKVVLSGEGADELFAGYQYLREYLGDPDGLRAELREITFGMHNLNLQRLDRMTMAHGLEGRVPFLDIDLIEVAFQVAPELKLHRGAEKWVLREVARDFLPEDIHTRVKAKFAIGTGVGALLEEHARRAVSAAELAAAAPPPGGVRPATREELLYWRHFSRRYGRADVVRLTGRSRSLNPGQRYPQAV